MIDEILKQFENQHGFFALTPGDLREFAEKIAAAEREACAKLADDWPSGRDDLHSIATSIRARGKK